MTRGNQRERDRERAAARKPNAKGPQDGLTPEQRRERDKKALEEKAAKKAQQQQQAAAGSGGGKGLRLRIVKQPRRNFLDSINIHLSFGARSNWQNFPCGLSILSFPGSLVTKFSTNSEYLQHKSSHNLQDTEQKLSVLSENRYPDTSRVRMVLSLLVCFSVPQRKLPESSKKQEAGYPKKLKEGAEDACSIASEKEVMKAVKKRKDRGSPFCTPLPSMFDLWLALVWSSVCRSFLMFL